MHTKSVNLLRATTPLVIILLLVIFVAPVQAGDPIPGVDVSLEQIPGGVRTTVQTDAEGNFVFNNLSSGTYLLRLVPLKPINPKAVIVRAEDHNSSRSNLSSIVNKGTKYYIVKIEVSTKVLPGKDPGITIKIGKMVTGRIFGQVTKATHPIKKKKVKTIRRKKR